MTTTPTSPGGAASGVIQAELNEKSAEQEERLGHTLAQGCRALETGQYGEAIQAFGAVIQERPADFNARLQRGRAYFWSGQHAHACAEFLEAWRLKEEHDRTARCYLVMATCDDEDENYVLGVFPEALPAEAYFC
jgi:Flp pilus assembly protein TadD